MCPLNLSAKALTLGSYSGFDFHNSGKEYGKRRKQQQKKITEIYAYNALTHTHTQRY